MSRRTATIAAVAAFVATTSIVGWRTWQNACVPGQPDLPLYGFHDFRDVFYYPAAATLDGRNPYDAEDYLAHYPVARPLAPYAPTTLVLHAPFALLPFPVARWVHFALNVALVLVLTWFVLRKVAVQTTVAATLGVGALVLLTRPAHMTLYIGQCTFYIVLGVYLALQCGRVRPWLAGLGLTLACVKPTFGLPVALVMLIRRDFRALCWGTVMTAVALGIIGSALVAFAGGIDPLVISFRDSFGRLLQDASANPATSVIRLDAAPLIGRLLGHPVTPLAEKAIALAVLALGLWCVSTLDGTPADEQRLPSSIVACLMTLTFSYHQAYDAVLLMLPAIAVATASSVSPLAHVFGTNTRRVLIGLMCVPWINYVATDTAIATFGIEGDLWRAVASTNGIAMLLAFAIAVIAVLRTASAPRTRTLGYTSRSIVS